MASALQQDTIEFTYDWYRSFLDLSEQYRFGSFADDPQDGDVFLRHDVDLSLQNAVTMARIEAEADVQSTYCIWLTSPLYNSHEGEQRERIQQIDDFGHDIALHFNTRTYWDDEPTHQSEIEQKVEEEQATLAKIAPGIANTVSFHKPPEWVLDRQFDGFQSTYAPEFLGHSAYHADSEQRWREEPPAFDVLSTPCQILTHPGLWGKQDRGFEDQVERGVSNACRYANRRAREEFISFE